MEDTDLPRQELVIVLSAHHAREKGFGPNNIHKDDPYVRCWWPKLGIDPLRGHRYQRVTADAAAVRLMEREHVGYVKEMCMDRRLGRQRPVWIEL